MPARDLGTLFDPGSVAVLGASRTAGKWGNLLAQTVLAGEHRREVYLVNRNGGEILGRPAQRSLGELPGPAELVLIVVPERGFERAVEEALAAGAKAIVAIVAGLGETGAAQRERERSVVQRVRDAGAALLGPNSMGVIDTATELSAAAHLTLPRGELALVTQSGGLGLDLGLRASNAGVGFSRFVSLGNQADLTAAEIVTDLSGHGPTRSIACYLEDIGEGREFAEAALRAHHAGRQVILLAPGRTSAAARGASSHTGSLASDEESINAVCAAAGITRVDTPGELFNVSLAFLRPRFPRGRRVGIVSDGGGAAVVSASRAERAGLEVPEFGDEVVSGLRGAASELASLGNPIDLLADDPDAMARTVERLTASGAVDALFIAGALGYNASRQYPPELGDRSDLEVAEVEAATRIGGVIESRGFPATACTISAPSPVIEELARFGVPMYRDVEAGIDALRRLFEAAERSPRGVPALPSPDAPVSQPGYREARDLLAAGGVRFADCRFVSTLSEAVAAAREIGFPVVVKALGQLHKSEHGGVVVGINGAGELEAAFRDLERRLAPDLLSVESMAPLADGVELIVGSRWDPRVGPVLMVGFGGVLTEIMRDVVTTLAPTEPDTVIEMLAELRGAELLRGGRGRSAVSRDGVAKLAAALSRVSAAHPEIAELEVNPVLALPGEALALDARMTLMAPRPNGMVV